MAPDRLFPSVEKHTKSHTHIYYQLHWTISVCISHIVKDGEGGGEEMDRETEEGRAGKRGGRTLFHE